jgi:ubiquinone/menaquinone biosynthesis C-methylase UbiE
VPTLRDTYVPALRFRALTPFYDRLISVSLKEDRFRRLLLAQADVRPGHRVLDLGCGTGTFAVLLKRAVPKAQVVGLDGDPEVLELARTKAREAGVEIDFRQGMAFDPPFDDQSFDRIVSTLVFHHLTTADKGRTLERARRLLRPGGEIHIADWGAAQNVAMRVAFLAVQALDGFATTSDSVNGRLPAMMERAGFRDVAETHREMTIFGTLAMYRGAAV